MKFLRNTVVLFIALFILCSSVALVGQRTYVGCRLVTQQTHKNFQPTQQLKDFPQEIKRIGHGCQLIKKSGHSKEHKIYFQAHLLSILKDENFSVLPSFLVIRAPIVFTTVSFLNAQIKTLKKPPKIFL